MCYSRHHRSTHICNGLLPILYIYVKIIFYTNGLLYFSNISYTSHCHSDEIITRNKKKVICTKSLSIFSFSALNYIISYNRGLLYICFIYMYLNFMYNIFTIFFKSHLALNEMKNIIILIIFYIGFVFRQYYL